MAVQKVANSSKRRGVAANVGQREANVMNWAACGRRVGAVMAAAQDGGWQHVAASAASSPDFSCISTFMIRDTCSFFEMPMSPSVVARSISEPPAMYSPVRRLSTMGLRYSA